jgi:hypothetical protein
MLCCVPDRVCSVGKDFARAMQPSSSRSTLSTSDDGAKGVGAMDGPEGATLVEGAREGPPSLDGALDGAVVSPALDGAKVVGSVVGPPSIGAAVGPVLGPKGEGISKRGLVQS